MVSESHQEMGGISGARLLDLKQWQKIQDLSAEIIGANLFLIEPSGTLLTAPSKVTVHCSDFSNSEKDNPNFQSDCAFKAFQAGLARPGGDVFSCPHQLNFFSIPIRFNDELVQIVIVGPILLGKREDPKVYEDLSKQLGIDSEVFLDRVREVRVFSHSGIRVVLDFLQELVHYLEQLNYHRQKLVYRKRHRFGQCPHCGYDLRGSSEHCPECGAILLRVKGTGA